jgi:hypothetical protein
MSRYGKQLVTYKYLIWNNYYHHYKTHNQLLIWIINKITNLEINYYSKKYIFKKIIKSYHQKKEEEEE